MITYRNIKTNSANWTALSPHFRNPREDDFLHMYFMIKDKIYYQWSSEFLDAFNKERTWEVLTDARV